MHQANGHLEDLMSKLPENSHQCPSQRGICCWEVHFGSGWTVLSRESVLSLECAFHRAMMHLGFEMSFLRIVSSVDIFSAMQSLKLHFGFQIAVLSRKSFYSLECVYLQLHLGELCTLCLHEPFFPESMILFFFLCIHLHLKLERIVSSIEYLLVGWFFPQWH